MERRTQEPQLPSSQISPPRHLVNATPSGEVQIRIHDDSASEHNSNNSDDGRDSARSSNGRQGQQLQSPGHDSESDVDDQRPSRIDELRRNFRTAPNPPRRAHRSPEYRYRSPPPLHRHRFSRHHDINNHGEPAPYRPPGNSRVAKDVKYHKPPSYDGLTPWQDHLVQFEIVAEINRWDDYQKALELATSLRGTAQGVLSDLHPHMRRDYRSLVKALETRFEPEDQSELYRAQIKSRLRKKNEPLPELAQDIKRLVRLAYPAAPLQVREQLARDCFIDALNDYELEWVVFQAKAETVTDAVRVALEFEAFQKGRNGRPNAKHGVRMQREVPEQESTKSSSEDKGSTSDDMLRAILNRIEQLEKSSQDYGNRNKQGQRQDKKCTYCGKLGHWETDCYRQQNDQMRKHNQNGRQSGKMHGKPARTEGQGNGH